jgi:hypothetical protein
VVGGNTVLVELLSNAGIVKFDFEIVSAPPFTTAIATLYTIVPLYEDIFPSVHMLL